ncbi:MAG TPA: dihydrolipoyl dehydrogenase, partial [Dissulfurispiraceae bacterium]|nr:dihydrolipoyl dehydrogenase [Dissulfurispiraceae bacterium]
MRLTVIGAGPGGYVAALKAAQLGAAVTVVETYEVGGTCLNWGCIPTKSLVSSAEAFHTVKRAGDFGIDLSGTAVPNMTKIMERKGKVVSTMIKGIRSLFKSWGVTLIEGRGTLRSPREVTVARPDGSAETIGSDAVIIATGSKPAALPLFPFDGDRILSSDDAVNLPALPKSIIMIGGGVIGCEFACIFQELGSDVSVIEALPRILATEDPAVSELMEREFKKRKISVFASATVEKVTRSDEDVRVILAGGRELAAEKLLVSVGRTFNTDGIGADEIGIQRGTKGEIRVNSRMETDVAGVYAVGDITGGMLLAHKASREGVVAAYNACGIPKEMRYDVIPAAIFTLPEIGSVGLREHLAAERGIAVRTGNFQYRTLGKAHAMGE